jgi:hypothetical protein
MSKDFSFQKAASAVEALVQRHTVSNAQRRLDTARERIPAIEKARFTTEIPGFHGVGGFW